MTRLPTLEEWESRIRAKHGAAVVRCTSPVKGGAPYEGAAPAWARCQLSGAWLLHLADGGSLTWPTTDVPPDLGDSDVVVVFRLAFGNGSPFPERTGAFDLTVDGRRVLSFAGVKDRRRWRGDDVDLLFLPDLARAARPGDALFLDHQLRSESWAAEGLGLLRIRRGRVTPGEPLQLGIRPAPQVQSRNWVRVGLPAFEAEVTACEPALDDLLAPDSPTWVGDRVLLYGDLHNHTGEGGWPGLVCGAGSRIEALTYARDMAALDFCCLSEHDWQIAEGEWEALQDLNDEWNQPGRFVTIHGYEWTSPSYGHRNVYFSERAGPFVRSGVHEPVADPDAYLTTVNARGDDLRTPELLWRALEQWGGAAMTIPHHSSAAMFPLSLHHYFHEGFDRVAEIYSCWGDSLHHDTDRNIYAQRIEELELSRFVDDYPIGFIASSDSHDGHPGNAQGHDARRHLFHSGGSGQVVVQAEDFTREGIFSAVYNRRCYGITGGRITLDVTLNGHPMGATVRSDELTQRPVLTVAVETAVPARQVEVFKGKELVHAEPWRAGGTHLEWEDRDFSEEGTYYVRVTREDLEVAWSSPIRVREALS
ncbi:MAG: DUF3604 domain-containing protein [Microthrixaceae bacterium]